MVHAPRAERLYGRAKVVMHQPGERVVVKEIDPPVYRLPNGLQPGDVVKLLDFSPGYWNVERESDGFRARISMVNIERTLK